MLRLPCQVPVAVLGGVVSHLYAYEGIPGINGTLLWLIMLRLLYAICQLSGDFPIIFSCLRLGVLASRFLEARQASAVQISAGDLRDVQCCAGQGVHPMSSRACICHLLPSRSERKCRLFPRLTTVDMGKRHPPIPPHTVLKRLSIYPAVLRTPSSKNES